MDDGQVNPILDELADLLFGDSLGKSDSPDPSTGNKKEPASKLPESPNLQLVNGQAQGFTPPSTASTANPNLRLTGFGDEPISDSVQDSDADSVPDAVERIDSQAVDVVTLGVDGIEIPPRPPRISRTPRPQPPEPTEPTSLFDSAALNNADDLAIDESGVAQETETESWASRCLADAIILEARCPRRPEIQLALDPEGGLHLIHEPSTGNLAQGLVRLLECRRWADEHRELLRLTCPEVVWDDRSSPTLHLITNDGPAAVQMAKQIGHLLRIHLLAIGTSGSSATLIALS
jgi:hypothetical protein